jgi:DNA mismatch repair ATPase MutS
VKTILDGITFDSKKEAARWAELRIMERAGLIKNLERQVPFKCSIDGHHICTWIADFVFFEGKFRVVEDVKSPFTRKLPVYRLKKKLVEALFPGTIIKEV